MTTDIGSPIEELQLAGRYERRLKMNGLRTIEQLTATSANQLFDLPKVGLHAINHVREKLGDCGLCLLGDEGEHWSTPRRPAARKSSSAAAALPPSAQHILTALSTPSPALLEAIRGQDPDLAELVSIWRLELQAVALVSLGIDVDATTRAEEPAD
jgi:hypothetical protein